MDKPVDPRKTRVAAFKAKAQPRACIAVHGARQNNLKNLSLEIPLQELVVVTGVSGSGKSSLVFDTLYAEGQRRYVETFSPYARQFLDRMDKPAVDRVDGIPPAIAIDQTNPVRTSRSTVGTMTELNDHLKLLFARAATLHCRNCGKPVRRDSAESIFADATRRAAAAGDPRVYVCFPVTVPKNFKEAEVRGLLEQQGYARIHERHGDTLEVVQDRLRLGNAERARIMESLETALRVGRGRVNLHVVDDSDPPKTVESWKYSSELHCADCDLSYRDPVPSLFSFNSPVGACETCRGFGRIIGIDYGLVVPDETKTLAGGAIKPWQTKSYKECQDDLVKFAKKRDIPLDTPWYALTDAQRKWVLDGEGKWEKKVWYGARRFFEWLETKSYKMHVRVLLSRYRAYTPCTTCNGSRLKPDALLWRVDGRNVHDLVLMSLDKSRQFFEALKLPAPLDEAADLLLGEVRARFAYLCEVGLGYLTLDRQSRTLSGGEVQRINLTTALGTSLVNTLFVLDEPSIGLHPRDMQRVVQVMHRLRDAGNSLVVVEHDPQIMLAADRLLDLGPGAGERGGEIVAFDTPEAVRANPKSLTGQYLSGAKIVAPRAAPRVKNPADTETRARMVPAQKSIHLRGVTQHNLKNIDVEFPLRRLVCITGVSGSGKSTLIEDVLYKALRKAKGQPSEAPGTFDRLDGAELVDDVVMIDQSSIGRTTRSNPASYVGAFDVVRELFANEPVAKARKYTPGTFSFNSGTGRCPTCSGNGFEHVEMQFLSDVYLRCPDCDGKRYRAETLEIRREGADGSRKNIAQVLDMTVTEALAFFRGNSHVAVRLQPLVDVGLEYVKLGQPVPTLSGGEAQRLKLAGELAEAAADDTPSIRGKLFLFDEPTTGLHFDDVSKLLRAFRKLLKIGHSLLVIEHNLDVMRSADWLIDLGPEGGDAGGQLVAAGTPAQIEANPASHTGRALREYEATFVEAVPGWDSREKARGVRDSAGESRAFSRESQPGTTSNSIFVHNAREHNLRNIDVEIPREAFTVVTGVSGSGKSTLAFDIIFNEGQRRYLESLNAYARQFVQPAARPDVDAIYGIPPTVAIEQRTSRGGRKSTVATLTEIYHFLRLLYVKLGTQFCPTCDVAIEPQTPASIAERVLKQHQASRVMLLAPLVVARKGYYTELAKWANARGYKQLRVDGEMLSTVQWPRLNRFKEHTIELPVMQLTVQKDSADALERHVIRALDLGKGLVHVLDLEAKKPKVQVFSIKRACPSCGTSFSELDPRLFSFNSKHGWCEGCFGTGLELEGFDEEQSGEERAWHDSPEGDAHTCETCHGQRLNPIALHVRFRDLNIADLTHQAIDETVAFVSKLRLNKREAEIARDLMAEIKSRMAFLQRVGLGYLPLDRSAPTLSGGEAQRIRLAAQLGSNLQGVCYVLDEPTIGLHPRDNKILLDALTELARHRNTLLVVEHDEDTIRRADHVIDLGPGAGVRGGEVVAAGTVEQLMNNPASITGRFLKNPLRHAAEPRRATGARAPRLELENVELHNVRKEDIAVPVGRLVVVTGVSGSGKSTVARDVLYANLKRLVAKPVRGAKPPELTGVKAVHGVEQINRVLEVDQTPIGKTPRSCPATYIGFWDDIRRIFANTTEAKIAGYSTSRFSFNTGEGRCPACEGQGMQTIEMNFLPDVKVLCDSCRGRRFNTETLSILWRGKSVGDLLAMNIDDAVEFFAAHSSIHHALRLLQDVGLGYLTLGQPSPTLSGGEAQRIKLVTELAKVRGEERRAPRQRPQHTLYVLDEPTVGLHMADVEKLIHVLHRLVDAGNSVVVVEHNLDVMAEADWIIDMGPEAGSGGGKIVAAGPPAAIMKVSGSHTGVVLKEFLRERRA
ncbi:MAG TPA: excinuclease ABC subunit UvrA [Steroidobacteraceae bacterium]|jgi:excinuclease ABC subunit A|nr:excinuclease ABC subunit UvrA [Steroidobacteraceae bacterium]